MVQLFEKSENISKIKVKFIKSAWLDTRTSSIQEIKRQTIHAGSSSSLHATADRNWKAIALHLIIGLTKRRKKAAATVTVRDAPQKCAAARNPILLPSFIIALHYNARAAMVNTLIPHYCTTGPTRYRRRTSLTDRPGHYLSLNPCHRGNKIDHHVHTESNWLQIQGSSDGITLALINKTALCVW